MEYSIFLIVLPLLLAFLSMFIKKGKTYFLLLGVFVNVLLLFMLEKGTYLIGGFKVPLGITLVIDQYSLIGLILVNTLFMFSVLANYDQLSKYTTVLLTLLAGVNGMLMTGDLFNLFVFLEITTISAYILTTMSEDYVGTFNYILVGAIGSGLYLLGIIILYAGFGTLNFHEMTQAIQASSANMILPMLLIFTGLSVEAKLLPLNGWVKGIYKNANGLVGTMMASVIASASLFVLGRMINLMINDSLVLDIALIIGVVTLILGEFSAFNSKKIKEILLYSSIGQSGLVTILMVSGLIFPAVMVIINNGVSKLIMFSVGHEVSKGHTKGYFSKHQLMGLAFTIASFSLIGLPLFFGFYVKLNSLLALFETSLLLPGIILLVTIIEGAYLIRLNIRLWHPGREGEVTLEVKENKEKSSLILIATTVVLSLLLLFSGLLPHLVGEKLHSETLLDEQTIEYIIDMKGGM